MAGPARDGNMKRAVMAACAATLIHWMSLPPALAQALPQPLSEPATGRELFLAAALAATMVCSIASFALLGRIKERTHVAIAMLAMLIGGFALLVLFGGYIFQHPLIAMLVLGLLFGLFRLMSLYEAGSPIRRGKSTDRPPTTP